MRHATVSPSAARILRMLSPYPWESDVRPSFDGNRVSWPEAYDSRISAQAQAPGFPRGSRQAILSARSDGAARRRRARSGAAWTGRRR